MDRLARMHRICKLQDLFAFVCVCECGPLNVCMPCVRTYVSMSLYICVCACVPCTRTYVSMSLYVCVCVCVQVAYHFFSSEIHVYIHMCA